MHDIKNMTLDEFCSRLSQYENQEAELTPEVLAEVFPIDMDKDWYTLENAHAIIINEVCMNRRTLAKHLNMAFQKGKQIAIFMAEMEREKHDDDSRT